MTIASALEMALAAVVLGVAVWTIAARDTFAAVAGFVAYGLLLALVWVRLDAVDVALTEAAIGGGLGGVLLLGAAARLRTTETLASAERPGEIVRLEVAVLSATVAAALAAGVLFLPEPAPTLAPAAAANAARYRPRQSSYERVDGISRDGHHAGEGRASARLGRRVVAGARSRLGRTPGAAPPG